MSEACKAVTLDCIFLRYVGELIELLRSGKADRAEMAMCADAMEALLHRLEAAEK